MNLDILNGSRSHESLMNTYLAFIGKAFFVHGCRQLLLFHCPFHSNLFGPCVTYLARHTLTWVLQKSLASSHRRRNAQVRARNLQLNKCYIIVAIVPSGHGNEI